MLLFSKQLKLWPFTTHMFFSLVKKRKKGTISVFQNGTFLREFMRTFISHKSNFIPCNFED